MNYLNAMLLADFYKLSHRAQYPENTQLVFSTWTPRTSRLKGIDKVVAFGFQGFCKEFLIDFFDKNFFGRPKSEVIGEYSRIVKFTLGDQNPETQHLEDLHDLGYLPIKIKAVKEGTLVPLRCPMLTIENTEKSFFWLTNYLETLMSCELWKQATSATIASKYRKLLDEYSLKTTGSTDFVQFQGHDFSMRGMSGLHDAARTGSGHLLSFAGTDTIPAIQYLEQFYGANVEKELVGCSVPATEHSVMMSFGKDREFDTYKRLITEVYPNGIVSIVSDTWNLWKVITDIIKPLKNKILAREGGAINKVVIRPDSGDPVEIVCGKKFKTFTKETCLDEKTFLEFAEVYMRNVIETETPHGEYVVNLTEDIIYDGKVYNLTYSPDWNRYDKKYYYIDNYGDKIPTINNIRELTPEDKGVVEALYDIFGGTTTEQGYKVLDSHIGTIYGDAITLERCEEICKRLEAKGFASTNMVYGIGSFTYQYNTRDTFGFALKSTLCVVDGEERQIFKDPITDSGVKKSQKGAVAVLQVGNEIVYKDELSLTQEVEGNLLETIFENGKLTREETFSQIKERLVVQS